MLKIDKNVPQPRKKSKEIVATILQMNDGDSLFMSYNDFTKTEVINAIANGRIRIMAKGLKLVSERTIDGTRIWAYKLTTN